MDDNAGALWHHVIKRCVWFYCLLFCSVDLLIYAVAVRLFVPSALLSRSLSHRSRSPALTELRREVWSSWLEESNDRSSSSPQTWQNCCQHTVHAVPHGKNLYCQGQWRTRPWGIPVSAQHGSSVSDWTVFAYRCVSKSSWWAAVRHNQQPGHTTLQTVNLRHPCCQCRWSSLLSAGTPYRTI